MKALAAALLAVSLNAAASDLDRSCAELSLEIGRLLSQQQQEQRGYFDLPGTRLAAGGTVVFKPAWFYLGYAAIRHLQNVSNAPSLLVRIKQLRTAAADKRCYAG